MASDRLYDLAFQFRKLKLWDRIPESYLYAVRFDDGETGYCSVMGSLGEHLALCVYLGQSGYASYHYLMDNAFAPAMTDRMELIAAQNSLQCSYEMKDELSEFEVRELRDYCHRSGKNLRGKNACPQFLRFTPGRYPWPVGTQEEENKIEAGLRASIRLYSMLDDPARVTKLQELWNSRTQIPMLTEKDGEWQLEAVDLPDSERTWPAPVLENEVLAARIRKMKKKGTWEGGTFYLTDPVLDSENGDSVPFFPLMLMTVDQESEMIVSGTPGCTEEPELILRGFAEHIADSKMCPKKILAADDRAFSLLKGFCSQTGIRLIREDDLQAFEEARDSLYDHMAGLDDWDEEDGWDDETDEGLGEEDADELDQFLSTLMLMRDEELKTMPRELVEMIRQMSDLGFVPDALIKRLRKLFP